MSVDTQAAAEEEREKIVAYLRQKTCGSHCGHDACEALRRAAYSIEGGGHRGAKSPRTVDIPKDLVRRGLTWGRGSFELLAYGETKRDLRDVPNSIEGVKVLKRVVGKTVPAGRSR